MSAVPLAGLTFIVYRQLVEAPVERSKSRRLHTPDVNFRASAFPEVGKRPVERRACDA